MINVDLVAFQFFKFTIWLETFMQVQLLFLEIWMSFEKLVAGGADALVAGALVLLGYLRKCSFFQERLVKLFLFLSMVLFFVILFFLWQDFFWFFYSLDLIMILLYL